MIDSLVWPSGRDEYWLLDTNTALVLWADDRWSLHARATLALPLSALVVGTAVITTDGWVIGWFILPYWQLVLRDFLTCQAWRKAVSSAHDRASTYSDFACLPVPADFSLNLFASYVVLATEIQSASRLETVCSRTSFQALVRRHKTQCGSATDPHEAKSASPALVEKRFRRPTGILYKRVRFKDRHTFI